MTPRDLFAVILKIVSIYLIIESFVLLPQMAFAIYQYGRMMMDSSQVDILEAGFFILLAIGTYILALRFCLFRTDWLIDKFRLDKGFSEEKFEINIHRSTVLKIAVIVIGALMVIDSLPLLCRQTISYLQMSHSYTQFMDNRSSGWMVYYFVKFVIGFCLISASRPIVNLIELKRKKIGETSEE